jgi:hypothetical protein
VWNAGGGPESSERMGMLRSEADEAMEDGVEAGEVDAAERVEREVVEDVRSESDRPSWRSFLFRGCSKGSSRSSSESDAGSSSSFGQR